MTPPKRKAKPDWADVYEMTVEHVNSLAEGEVDEEIAQDEQRRIFTALLETIYGESAPGWYQTALKAATDADLEVDADDEDDDDEDDLDDELEEDEDDEDP